MSVATQPERRAGSTPPSVSTYGQFSAAALADATQRSQDYLLSVQHPDGYWVGELIVDATLVADMVAYHHWSDTVDPEWQRRAVNHIFERQLEDGGWNIYPHGPAEVNATIKAYLALKLSGVPDRKSTRLNSSHEWISRMPSSA